MQMQSAVTSGGLEGDLVTVPPIEKKKGVSGSTLKLIAIITMFIDHVGAIILERIIYSGYSLQLENGGEIQLNAGINTSIFMIDGILRLIGRLGFPIFCFLLIEGFKHTRNIKKYAGRLFLFALISEIPFDLGFSGKLFAPQYQNVFFTLLIGLFVIMGFHMLEEKGGLNKAARIILSFVMLAAGMAAAELLQTDYRAFGVLTIAIMYLFRHNRTLETGLGCTVLTVMSVTEITSYLVMIPIHKYNGKRGWNIKWFFYAFYPLHILLLYLIACLIGYGQVPLYLLH